MPSSPPQAKAELGLVRTGQICQAEIRSRSRKKKLLLTENIYLIILLFLDFDLIQQ